jgi:hypothetical protein
LEAPPVQRPGTVDSKRAPVASRSVALVSLPPPLRLLDPEIDHDPIAMDLGED